MTEQSPHKCVSHFPVTMFATTMGLSGLTIATGKMDWMGPWADTLSMAMAFLTFAIYITILALYTFKSLRHPQAVLQEWDNPIKISFFPAASISLLLLGAAFLPINERISFFLWATGTFFQFFISLAIIHSWINHERYQVIHSTPAWFIPVVGNIIVPIAGVPHMGAELSWFFFTWGFLFWVILLTLIMNRLVFHNPIPQKLLPTLFIILAPPSIGFVSYTTLTGQLDSLARMMFYAAVFFFIVLLGQIRRFAKVEFSLAWWAYTFPMAAFTIANNVMGELTGNLIFTTASYVLYIFCCAIIVSLTIRTFYTACIGRFFLPE